MPDKIPVSVLTGFLGSGKTTLLSRLLSDPALADTAVIINEFGEMGLDHLLVQPSDESVVELANGCLCCAMKGGLGDTLEALYTRRQRGEVAPFRRVVVETSGLADPAPLLHAVMAQPVVSSLYSLDSVVALVDGVAGARSLDEFPEAVKQVALADRILLTKRDLAHAEDLYRLAARLRHYNPGAPMLAPAPGSAEPAWLFGGGVYDPAARGEAVLAWLAAEAQPHHDHGSHAVDGEVESFCVELAAPVPAVDFAAFLARVVDDRGDSLLRLKGLVDVADRPGTPALIHGVQHIFHPVVWLPAWPGGEVRSRLVFIGRGGVRDAVDRLLGGLVRAA